MASRTVEVPNRRGLHARASAKFVTLAANQTAAVEVEKDGSRVCGTSIMGLMMLAAGHGSVISVNAEGADADAALAAIADLIDRKFEED